MPVVPVDAVAPFDGTHLAHFLLSAKALLRFSHPSHARALESSIRRTVSTRDRALRTVRFRKRPRDNQREEAMPVMIDPIRREVVVIGANGRDEGISVAPQRSTSVGDLRSSA
jgi:hypothetical protein